MKSTKRNTRNYRARGMTLIEIMVVITLLGIIAASVGVAAVKMMDTGRMRTARMQAFELGKAVQTYRVMYGRWPPASEGLTALTTPRGGAPLVDRLPLDPWGNAYTYVFPGIRNPTSFDICSRGPDGEDGTDDDVGNWPEAAP